MLMMLTFVEVVAVVVTTAVVAAAVVASAEAAPMTNAYLNADGCVCALELSASRWELTVDVSCVAARAAGGVGHHTCDEQTRAAL
jgi:hypothetical protein